MEYLLAVSVNLANPLHLVYDNGNNGGVQWWEKCCDSTSVCTHVAWMGVDAYTMEEFWFLFFFWTRHTPPVETCALMSGTKGCLEAAWCQSVSRFCEYLSHFFAFEVRGHDGTQKGQIHVIGIYWKKEWRFDGPATVVQ